MFGLVAISELPFSTIGSFSPTATLVGVVGTGIIGSVTATPGAAAVLTGVQATIFFNSVCSSAARPVIWSTIDTDQSQYGC
jgi:hypothetical protein